MNQICEMNMMIYQKEAWKGNYVISQQVPQQENVKEYISAGNL